MKFTCEDCETQDYEIDDQIVSTDGKVICPQCFTGNYCNCGFPLDVTYEEYPFGYCKACGAGTYRRKL